MVGIKPMLWGSNYTDFFFLSFFHSLFSDKYIPSYINLLDAFSITVYTSLSTIYT